ncbi:MAG: hypothetical protein MJZ00_02905 [Paludibacteraceae bacterium]|nr:hypothetical protein [Paludibacteraceae bacterium]
MGKTQYRWLLHLLPAFGMFAFGAASCIQEEIPSSECNIEKIILHHPNPETVFYDLSDSIRIVPVSDDDVIFEVKSNADLSLMNIEYVLTEGTSRNNVSDYLSDTIKIQTTSEDGRFNRLYSILFSAQE